MVHTMSKIGASELLVPDPSDIRELEAFANVPEQDQQAWLYFVRASHNRESIGIKPVYTFDQFDNGIASHTEGFVPLLDDFVEKGLGETALIHNFSSEYPIDTPDQTHILEPVLGAFDGSKRLVERERAKGPLGLIVPHSSLATPYVVTRSLLHTLGPELAKKVYIVVGPRPLVMDFEFFNKKTQKIQVISPVGLGRILGNLMMTGPDTDSVRGNEILSVWLKDQRRDFWANMDRIMEPQPNGDNNIVVFCPAGRVAEDNKEFRVDGSFEYLIKYPNLRVLPVGAFDRLLKNPDRPDSGVFINPDKSVWNPTDEKHANYLHKRAVQLGRSPYGGQRFETQFAHNTRLTRQKISAHLGTRPKTKGLYPPYLSD